MECPRDCLHAQRWRGTLHWYSGPTLKWFLQNRFFLFFTTTFKTDADGESSCDFTTCEAASTATAVEAFAASNEVLHQDIVSYLSSIMSSYVCCHICHCVFRKVWVPAFAEVFTKMLAHGSTELFDPEDAWKSYIPIFLNISIYWFSTIYSPCIRPQFTECNSLADSGSVC